MIIVRKEAEEHTAGVYQVEEKAFNRKAEADLCVKLRQRGGDTLSLVALEDGQVLGHVLFSPVTLKGESHLLEVIGLGPVAVLPSHQRQGIGSRLIRAGLEEIRQMGYPAVVVLGDPRYYSRFGFEPAARYGIHFPDPNVPADDFMVLELRRGVLEGHSGQAHYAHEFLDV